jgi:O-antigen/teichoic acid export membrane protein
MSVRGNSTKKAEESAAESTFWTLGGRIGERALGVISIAALARLLSPSDFGIVAMAGAVASFVEVFGLFGFDWALVRLQAPTVAHYNTAWSLRLTVTAVLACITASLAVPTALFFKTPQVTPLLLMIAANILIGSLENIGTVDFRRNMQFKKEFALGLIAKFVGFGVSLTIAFTTRSYWALILGITANRAASVIGSYVLSSFRPRLDYSKRSDLLAFSSWILLGSLAETAQEKLTNAFIGRTFGAAITGLYAMATELSLLATTEIAAPINRAMFSRYVHLNQDINLLRSGFLTTSGIIWLIGLPTAIGLASCAPEVIGVALGNHWTGAAQVLSLLAFSGAAKVTAANTHYIYWALGRSKLVTTLSLIDLALFIPAATAGSLLHGIVGIAYASVFASVCLAVINYSFLLTILDLSLWTIIKRNCRIVIATSLMGTVIVYSSSHYPQNNHIAIKLLALVLIGVSVYTVVITTLWLLSSKPDGAERTFLTLFLKTVKKSGVHLRMLSP